MADTRARLALLGWVALLGGGLVLLDAAGGGPLAGPPAAPERWADWADGRAPAVAAVAVLRLLAFALDGYLLAATLLAVVARAVGSLRVLRLADAVTVPAVRQLVAAAVGAGLSTALALAPPARLPAATPAAAASAAAEPVPLPPGLLPDPTGPVAGPTPTGPDRTPPPAGPAPPARDAPAATPPTSTSATSWRVEPGDHLWAVAERTLARTLGRAPDDAEIVPYWRRLIDVNRDRLVVPDDPDLLYPGQVLTVPAPDGDRVGSTGAGGRGR